MKKNKLLLIALSMILISCGGASSNDTSQNSSSFSTSEDLTGYDYKISKKDYYDKVYAGIQAELWGNFTGLPVEFHFIDAPCQNDRIEWVVSNSYVTDDDTSIEYVMSHMMEVNGVDSITYQDIAEEWVNHINDYIWEGNLASRNLMSQGYIPPLTGSKKYNSAYRAIDAQIECEILGQLTPGMKLNAKERGAWWAKVVADDIAVECTAFFTSLVSELFFAKDTVEAIKNVLALFDNQRINEMVNDVLNLKQQTSSWREARYALYQKYYLNNPGRPRNYLDSEINFVMVILALVYGENDFDKTGQIALLAGFDNDCTAATSCLMLATMLGYDALPENLRKQTGDMYINTNRPGLPSIKISDYANKICSLGYQAIINKGGKVDDEYVYIKDGSHQGNENINEYVKFSSLDDYSLSLDGYQKIYDNSYDYNIYSSSKVNDKLSFKVKGTSFALIGQANLSGGDVEVDVDGKKYITTLNLNPTMTLGEYVNDINKHTILRLSNLENKEHTVTITSLDNEIHTIVGIETYLEKDEFYTSEGVNFSLASKSKAITSVNNPRGGGNKSINVIKDGKYFKDENDLANQYDTFLGYSGTTLVSHDFEDYFGIEFEQDVEISKVVFQEGGHFNGGGWFSNGSLRLELKINGSWVKKDFQLSPEYPNSNNMQDFSKGGELFTFTFDRTSCDGFRVIGNPGGYQKLTSCGELECYR